MVYIIDWSEEKTTSTGKQFKKVTAKDEQGNVFEGNIWSDASFYAKTGPGSEVEAEIRVTPDGKYKSLVDAKIARTQASTWSRGAKTAEIKEAMEKKAEQIHAAQDRSAWMWAKTNASTLLSSGDIRMSQFSNEEILARVVDLATKIYNAEPNTPFNG